MDLTIQPMPLPAESQEQTGEWQLKKLSIKHREVASLLAQGLDRATIAAITKYSEGYITWLGRQPLFREYIAEMSQYQEVKLEAMFQQSVDAIGDTLQHGNPEERLKAARLQLEATRRVGRGSEQGARNVSTDKLVDLADRLVGLLNQQRSNNNERTIEGDFSPVHGASYADSQEIQISQSSAG
jgi:hypothetical protein